MKTWSSMIRGQKHEKPEVESTVVLAEMNGHLKVKVVKATDLAFKDPNLTSDPFVILTLGKDRHKSRTTIKNDDLTPIWNEVFTFSVKNAADSSLLKVELWDNDRLRRDDKLGDVEIDMNPMFEKQSKHRKLVSPCKENCLYNDSSIIQYADGRKIQQVWLKLRNVDSGLLNLQFEWLPCSR